MPKLRCLNIRFSRDESIVLEDVTEVCQGLNSEHLRAGVGRSSISFLKPSLSPVAVCYFSTIIDSERSVSVVAKQVSHYSTQQPGES